MSLLVLFVSVIMCLAETEHFEKGDLLFSKGFMWYGHTAIYYGWDGVEDPDKRQSHLIIESDSSILTYPEPGVIANSYSDLYTRGYRGAGTLMLYAEQRQRVVDFVNSKRGYKYTFLEGYKDRTIGEKFYKTYRCDGLAEHSYEVARGNYGIVKDTNWNGAFPYGLYPYKQQANMGAALGIKPYINVPVIAPSKYKDGNYYIKDEVTILCADVSDGERGSGIAKVEFWLGKFAQSLDESIDKLIGIDSKRVIIKGDYQLSWDTTVSSDNIYNLYARAFDQAGNTKISPEINIVVNNTPPIITEENPTGTVSDTRPIISVIIISEDNIVPLDPTSIIMTLDGSKVDHVVDAINNNFSIKISYAPITDFEPGEHIVTVNARDIMGLLAREKKWSFKVSGNFLWYTDTDTDSPFIYKLNEKGEIIKLISNPAKVARGIAYDGKYLYVVDPYWRKAYKLSIDGTIILSFTTPNWSSSSVSGITWDGAYLWLVDKDPTKLFSPWKCWKYTSDGSLLSSFFLDDFPFPFIYSYLGIAYVKENSNDFLYLTRKNILTNKTVILKYSIEGSYIGIWKEGAEGEFIYEIEFDGTYLWEVSLNINKYIKKYSLDGTVMSFFLTPTVLGWGVAPE